MKPHHRTRNIVCGVLAGLLVAALGFGWACFGPQLRAASSVQRLEDGLYALEYRGDYGFDAYLAAGGGASDAEMGEYIASFLSHGMWKPAPAAASYGCSTIAVKNGAGEALFGRNFDWTDTTAILVHTVPTHGYESISTCCAEFLGFGEGWVPEGFANQMMALAAVYVPLDGMNEKGLCVADLVAGDDDGVHQDTDQPDLTTTAGIRLMLDHAATVDEAVALLEQYDMNASIGAAHHYAISDAAGKSVVVEYVGGEMSVIETPFCTNFYLTPGEKYGIGSEQSHIRFDTLAAEYAACGGVMEPPEVRDALDSVAQKNFPGSSDITVWSLVYEPAHGTAQFYRSEHYGRTYRLYLGDAKKWLSYIK